MNYFYGSNENYCNSLCFVSEILFEDYWDRSLLEWPGNDHLFPGDKETVFLEI
jgi:hypothetical protein